MATPELVIFACIHNAGRSQMSAALFDLLADPEKAVCVSAGTEPGMASSTLGSGARVHRGALLNVLARACRHTNYGGCCDTKALNLNISKRSKLCSVWVVSGNAGT